MGRVRALATPSLLAMEHQEAEVIIGDRLGYSVTTTINNVSTESIQFLESGVILKVVPFIDRFGRIMMKIHPEVSTGTINEDTGIPDQATTEVTTHLLVEDGQTIFIGGLIRSNITSGHQGVPILEDIPLLNYFFTKDDNVALNTETIVMITPHIINQNNISLLTSPGEKVERFSNASKE
jgi:type II secretory pathway component GspD/PulD (secretin)